MFQRTLSREDYTVGIICALEFEKEAVEATLDEKHGMVQRTPGDNNDYAFGKMGEHNVVIACLPASVMSPSAAVAKVMMCSFPIKIGFVVGVGDGVWTEVHDIRLGDLVVSRPDDGMVQWDYGKTEESGRLWRTGKLRRPPQPLLQMLRYTQNDGELGMILEAALAEHPLPRDEIGHQGLRHNEFFEASYEHTGGETCTNCDRSRLVRHRPHRTNLNSRVYHSKIGSSIEVLERGPMRDHIAREEGMLRFETEAAGLPDTFPCLVIRGVCSYADSHTNTRWQGYAAMAAAAACAKCLLLCVLREGLATIPLASENTESPISKQVVCLPIRNSRFVGRRAELEILERRIVTAQDCQRFAVFGPVGMGKSELVLKFAFSVAENQPEISVFWISAANAEVFERGTERIARGLGIQSDAKHGLNVKDLVKRHLSATSAGKWLLIVDNVGAFEHSEQLLQHLPDSPLGVTIFTTRQSIIAHRLAGSDVLEAQRLSPSEAAKLLKLIVAGADSLEDAMAVPELLAALEHVPLGITQAATAIDASGVSISKFSSLMRRGFARSSALDNKIHGPRPQRRPRRIPAPHAYPVDASTSRYTLDGIDSPQTSQAPGAPSLSSPSARKPKRLQRIKPCYVMVVLGFLAIGGSLAVGLFYSIAQDRMGDGFTTAGWMVAVSTLMLAAPMAKHYPKCRCWEGHEYAVL